MKELKLTEQQIDYLNGLLAIEEDKILNRLDRRVDMEENNVAKLNIVREIMNSIYLLDKEENRKQGGVGFKLDEEEVIAKSLRGLYEEMDLSMDEVFDELDEEELLDNIASMGMDNFVEKYVVELNNLLQEEGENYRLNILESTEQLKDYLLNRFFEEVDEDVVDEIAIGDTVKLIVDQDGLFEEYIGTLGTVVEIDGEYLLLDCENLGMCQAHINEVEKI